jgi:hypothetical protein
LLVDWNWSESLDQKLLWTSGKNATTSEHVDMSDLGFIAPQLGLVHAKRKPIAEPLSDTSKFRVLSLENVASTAGFWQFLPSLQSIESKRRFTIGSFFFVC